MKKYSISKPRKYTDKNGNEKTFWDRVGEMIEFEKQDGSVSRIVKIPAIGLEANVFEDKPREQGFQPPMEEVNLDDIPF